MKFDIAIRKEMLYKSFAGRIAFRLLYLFYMTVTMEKRQINVIFLAGIFKLFKLVFYSENFMRAFFFTF